MKSLRGFLSKPIASRLPLALVLLPTFASFLFAPLYMAHLRHQLAAGLPEEWEKVTNNGPFAYISNFIVTTRNYEEGTYSNKVVQIIRHGFPYDPYTGDRSLKSWFFDCMMFYPIAPFVVIAGGNIHYGWILAHATLGALWVLLFYEIFLFLSEDVACSLLFATLGFFFGDSVIWFLMRVVPALLVPHTYGPIGSMLFHFVARACGQVQFMRLPTPGMTYLWLYGALAGAFLLSISPRRRFLASAAVGIVIGLLCLAHFYEWVFGVGCAFLLLLAGLSLNFYPNGSWNLGIINAFSVPLSIAYYVFSQRLVGNMMPDIINRMGIPNTRSFTPTTLIYLILAASCWIRARQSVGKARFLWIFGAIQEVTAFAIANLSLIMGYDMQFNHVYVMAGLTGVLAVFGRLLESQDIRKRLRPHAAVVIAAIFCWVFLREKAWSDTHFKIFGTPRDVAEAGAWINNNTPPESLWVTLSGVLTEFLPQIVPMRFAVSNGAPSYGEPLYTSQNLGGLAQILKTLRANEELFIEKRWRHFGEWEERKNSKTYLSRNFAWPEAERAKWAYFLLNIQIARMQSGGPEEVELRQLIKTSPELPRPFYFWLQKGDEEFLTATPESLGGDLIYQNSTARLYYFPADGNSDSP